MKSLYNQKNYFLGRIIFFALLVICSTNNLFAQLSADFSEDTTAGCSPVVIEFEDESTGSPTSWDWDFGNGNTSTNQNPKAAYSNPGVYTVKLIVEDNNGNKDTIVKQDLITVYENPKAGFTSDTTEGCEPVTINYSDESLKGDGTINDWKWDFGDGIQSSSQNPSHEYTGPGDYTVSLVVKDDNNCQAVETKTKYIHVIENDLSIDFTASTRVLCNPGDTVDFINQSSGSDSLMYEWELGDGNTSTEINPSNIYNTEDTFDIKLNTTNTNGCEDSLIEEDFITVYNSNDLDFTVDKNTACEGEVIQFINKTPGSESQKWKFGDGNTSVQDTSTHKYSNDSTYDITLIVSRGGGRCEDTLTKTDLITINSKPEPGFTSDTTRSCETPFSVNFQDTSKNASQWNWDFGDGNTATGNSPTNSYMNEGKFDVKLIVSNTAGCEDSITKQDKIIINKPEAGYDFNTDIWELGGCPSYTFSAFDTSHSVQPISSWEWDLKDTIINDSSFTHTLDTTGEYPITFKIENQWGCRDSVMNKDTVFVTNPPSDIGFENDTDTICALSSVSFMDTTDNSVEWYWYFGDNSTQDSVRSPTHTYKDSGVFDVKLVSYNKLCPDTLTKDSLITVLAPVPSFSFTKNCADPFTVEFKNESVGDHHFEWDFGNGVTDTVNNDTSITYSTNTNYNVSLTTSNDSTGCTNQASENIDIFDVKAGFTVDTTIGCSPLTVSFTDTSQDAVVHEWSFGDGVTTTKQNPEHTYFNPGKYDITLIVSDQDGCKDTLAINNHINVLDIHPEFSTDSIYGCDSLTVEFSDSSNASPSVISRDWEFGDGQSSTDKDPIHVYEDTGRYDVTLEVTNSEGSCRINKPLFIDYLNPVADFNIDNKVICPGGQVTFTNNSKETSKFFWDFENNGRDTVTDLNFDTTLDYSQRGYHTITLRSINKRGCDSVYSDSFNVKKPIADFSVKPDSSFCPPLASNFSDSSSNGTMKKWKWSFGDSSNSNLQDPTHIYTATGDYDVSLIVENGEGCKDTVTKPGVVLVDGPLGNFSFEPDSGCQPHKVEFNANAEETDIYTWDYGDGNVVSGPDSSITHKYKNAGSYFPLLILEDSLGCKFTINPTDSVFVKPSPTAGFTFPDTIFTKRPFQLKDQSEDAVEWFWDLDENKNSSVQNPEHVFMSAGEKTIEQIVTASNKCKDTIIKNLKVVEYLFIPNVFSPNNDGKNDVFKAIASGFKEFEIKIFNRWGELMFETNHPTINWDGRTLADKEAPQGSYIYVVKGKTESGNSVKRRGTVTLFR
ncbi:MAG: PKD domain-containing protein [Flavobacteriales bacterium]